MNLNEITAMTLAQRDEMVARRVMGWTLFYRDKETGIVQCWRDKDGGEHWRLSGFHPSTDHNACAEMRRAIRNRGMHDKFANTLALLMSGDHNGLRAVTAFELIDAAPEQQVIAALLCVE